MEYSDDAALSCPAYGGTLRRVGREPEVLRVNLSALETEAEIARSPASDRASQPMAGELPDG